LQHKNTYFILVIPLETKVVGALAHLCSGNSLQMVGEVYGIVESIASIIVCEFCEGVSKHLKPFVFMKPIDIRIKANDFRICCFTSHSIQHHNN
jgi:hypothetical protein